MSIYNFEEIFFILWPLAVRWVNGSTSTGKMREYACKCKIKFEICVKLCNRRLLFDLLVQASTAYMYLVFKDVNIWTLISPYFSSIEISLEIYAIRQKQQKLIFIYVKFILTEHTAKISTMFYKY